jgi:hypothetical protein
MRCGRRHPRRHAGGQHWRGGVGCPAGHDGFGRRDVVKEDVQLPPPPGLALGRFDSHPCWARLHACELLWRERVKPQAALADNLHQRCLGA